MKGRVSRMLAANNVQPDSARAYIRSSLTVKLKENFWNCVALENNTSYTNLYDSTSLSSQWNTSYVKKIEKGDALEKIIYANDDNPANKHFGRIMNKYNLDNLRALMQENNLKRTICLNKFEIKDRGTFSNQIDIILHFEIYDANANKVYGGKLAWNHSLAKGVSYTLFLYWLRNAMDDFYLKMKELNY